MLHPSPSTQTALSTIPGFVSQEQLTLKKIASLDVTALGIAQAQQSLNQTIAAKLVEVGQLQNLTMQSIFYDVYELYEVLKTLQAQLSIEQNRLTAIDVSVTQAGAITAAEEDIKNILGRCDTCIQLYNSYITPRKILIVYDKTGGAFVKVLNFKTNRGTQTYSSQNVTIQPVESIDEIAKAVQAFLEKHKRLDCLYILGHGKAAYLWVGGGTNPTTKSDSTPQAFSISVVDASSKSYQVTALLRKQTQNLVTQASIATGPVIVLVGCNVAYLNTGETLIQLMSRNIFPDCLVVGFNQYSYALANPVDANDKDNRWLSWPVGTTESLPIRISPQYMVVAYQGTTIPWQTYQANRFLGQKNMNKDQSLTKLFSLDVILDPNRA